MAKKTRKTPKGCVREKNFFRCRQESPKKFDKRSFRTVKRGRNLIVVGCPRGKYSAKKNRCKVGMRAQSILRPVK